MLPGNFYVSEICHVIFLWLIFGPGIFWVLLEALGIFWVSNFAPIQSSLSLEIQSPHWGYIVFVCFYFSLYQSL